MPRSKPDLSRLVMLSYTPSEAVTLGSLLLTMRERALNLSRDDKVVLNDSLARISLQLKHLQWPEQPRKAPYPV
jgi:hypothetical protein